MSNLHVLTHYIYIYIYIHTAWLRTDGVDTNGAAAKSDIKVG